MVSELLWGAGAVSGVNAAFAGETAAQSGDLVRGAIGGAFIIALAFLAGFAVFRRSAAAVCALLMVVVAAALEFNWLGLLSIGNEKIVVFLHGLFGASVLIYLSSTVRAARRSPLLGGLMFAGALTMAGLGAINFLGRVDADALMIRALIGVAGFAGLLALLQSLRGDHGARLLLPGIALAAAAPFTGDLAGPVVSMTPHALFTFGVLAASLVTLTEGGRRDAGQGVLAAAAYQAAPSYAGRDDSPSGPNEEQKMLVSENQLAQVLDYAGVAVWDWSDTNSHQTGSFAALFDADEVVRVTPRRLRDFIHPSERARFEHVVFGRHEGDGAFDVTVKLRNENFVRLRGARAVDDRGELERLVVFAEPAPDASPKLWDAASPAARTDAVGAAAYAPVDTDRSVGQSASQVSDDPATASLSRGGGEKRSARSAKTEPGGRAAPSGAAQTSADAPSGQDRAGKGHVAKALDEGRLEAAFQPIVSLSDQSVRGYEALLRARADAPELKDLSTEEIVSAAEGEGAGDALAAMMLKASTRFLAERLKARKRKDLFVAFNVSYAQMRADGFVDAVRSEIDAHALPPKALVIELTEAEAVSDDKAAKEIFSALKTAGAALAFDDFGSGFSSLSNLQKFSFDYLKVDKSFVERLGSDREASKIVSAVAGLGSDLGLTVIAEGLSTKKLAEAALKHGCKLGQGYAFGEPEPAAKTPSAPLTLGAAAPASEPPRETGVNGAAAKADAGKPAKNGAPPQASRAPATADDAHASPGAATRPGRRHFWSTELR